MERSIDASNWEYVNVVFGSGNSNLPLNYYSFDKNPYSGTSYNRVKQTDFDGEIS